MASAAGTAKARVYRAGRHDKCAITNAVWRHSCQFAFPLTKEGTDLVVVDEDAPESKRVAKARERGIPVVVGVDGLEAALPAAVAAAAPKAAARAAADEEEVERWLKALLDKVTTAMEAKHDNGTGSITTTATTTGSTQTTTVATTPMDMASFDQATLFAYATKVLATGSTQTTTVATTPMDVASFDQATLFAYATKVLAATSLRTRGGCAGDSDGACCGCKRRARYNCRDCRYHRANMVAPWLPPHNTTPPQHVGSSFLHRFLRALEDVALRSAHHYGRYDLQLLSKDWDAFFGHLKWYCRAMLQAVIQQQRDPSAGTTPAFTSAHGERVAAYLEFMREHTVSGLQHGAVDGKPHALWGDVAELLCALYGSATGEDIAGMRPLRAGAGTGAGAGGLHWKADGLRGVLYAFGHADTVRAMCTARDAHGEAGLSLGAPLPSEHRRGLLDTNDVGDGGAPPEWHRSTVPMVRDVIHWVISVCPPATPPSEGYHAINALASLHEDASTGTTSTAIGTATGPLDRFVPRATDNVALWRLAHLHAYVRASEPWEGARRVVRADALEAGLRAHTSVFQFTQARTGADARVQCACVRDPEAFDALRQAVEARVAARRRRAALLARAREYEAEIAQPRLRTVHAFLAANHSSRPTDYSAFCEVAMLHDRASPTARAVVVAAINQRQRALLATACAPAPEYTHPFAGCVPLEEPAVLTAEQQAHEWRRIRARDAPVREALGFFA